jgi:hypothetical protein
MATVTKETKITEFGLKEANIVRERVQESLAEFAESLGIGVKLGRGTYSGNKFTLAVDFVIKKDGVLETDERKAYKSLAKQYGLEPEWLDKTFVENGETFTVVGLNSRKARPVLCQGPKGMYNFPEVLVRGLMTGDVEGAQRRKMEICYSTWGVSTGLLKKEWLNKPFDYQGETVTAIGMVEGKDESSVVILRKNDQKSTMSISRFRGAMTGTLQDVLKKEREAELFQLANSYRWQHASLGLQKNWLNQTITLGKTTYTIVGLDASKKRKKDPVVLQDKNGGLGYYPVSNTKLVMTQQHPELAEKKPETPAA